MTLSLRKIILTSVCLSLFTSVNSFAQAPWLESFLNGQPLNFYTIQKNFYANYKKQYNEFLKEEHKKGKEEEVGEKGGIIQFKRWESFWQPRVNSDGSFPPANILYTENKKYWEQNSLSDE